MLKEQTAAPSFSLEGDDDTTHTLSEFKGDWLVVYFYPKDDTPGCTVEACGLRDNWSEFATEKISVIGISADSVASHQKFKKKHSLPFLLLSDPEKKVIAAYDAWGEKSLFGKKFHGIKRITYIIDPEQKIAKAYPKVSPATHAKTLLKDIQALR